jgi:hypothetical protein
MIFPISSFRNALEERRQCSPEHSQQRSLVRDMAHWQLSPVERALERPAGGAAKETGTPSGGWREALLTTNPGSVKPV